MITRSYLVMTNDYPGDNIKQIVLSDQIADSEAYPTCPFRIGNAWFSADNGYYTAKITLFSRNFHWLMNLLQVEDLSDVPQTEGTCLAD